jgi:YegS C-terminal NAD kinase beta sandwich-like domain
VTIRKGEAWGHPGPLPDDGVVVASDHDAAEVIERARREGRPYPPLGLVGGDLCRTLGGSGGAGRLRTHDAVTFPVDLGEALVDGRLRFFVAHLVARNRWWTRAFVVMNAQWVGGLNLGPRAHPNDGLLDVYDARLGFSDVVKVRARARAGAHLPHPGIKERRVPAAQVGFDRPTTVWLDGVRLGPARHLSVRVDRDALTVVV